MRSLRTHRLTLLSATVSLLAIIGSILLLSDAPVVAEASQSEAELRVEVDDIDQLDHVNTLLSHEIVISSIGPEWFGFEVRHDSPLVAHSWRWCSRGPPRSDC